MDALLGMTKDWLKGVEGRGFECYNVIQDIIFENGEFTAVCNCGNVFTSSDGKAWARKYSSTRLRGIDWCKDRYIATGLGGLLLTGTSQSALSVESSGTGANLRGACFGTEKEDWYIAVGDGGAIVGSKINHTSWKSQSSPTGNDLFACAFGPTPKIYVAVGAKGTVLWSDDPDEPWKPGSGGGGTEAFLGVYFNNNKFVAVGTNGISAESSDGKSWSKGAPWGDVKDMSGRRDIRSVGGSFVGVGYNGAVISGSGTSWSLVVDPFKK